MGRSQAGEQRTYPWNRSKRRLESLTHPRPQMGEKAVGEPSSLRAVMLQHRSSAAPEKQLKRLGELEPYTARCEHLGKTLTAQHLAVDEDAITVEDDQVELAQAGTHCSMRSYAHPLSNSP